MFRQTRFFLKLQLFDFMTANGIPCAEYMAVHSMEELDKAVKQLGYPEKKSALRRRTAVEAEDLEFLKRVSQNLLRLCIRNRRRVLQPWMR